MSVVAKSSVVALVLGLVVWFVSRGETLGREDAPSDTVRRPLVRAPAPPSETTSAPSAGAPAAVKATAGAPTENEPTVSKQIEEIRDLLRSGNPEKAVAAAEAALKANPNDEQLLLEVASLQGQVMQDKARAEALLVEMVRRFPNSPQAAGAMGDFLSRQGRYEEATPHLRRAATDDAPSDAHLMLGHNLMNRRDYAGALSSFEEAYHRAQAELDAKQASSESTLYTQRKVGDIAIDRGFALMENGRVEEAWKMVRESQRLLGAKDDRAALLARTLENRQNPSTTTAEGR